MRAEEARMRAEEDQMRAVEAEQMRAKLLKMAKVLSGNESTVSSITNTEKTSYIS